MYHYRCESIRVIDGDTVQLEIDLGCHVRIRRIVRLLGINTPEISGETLHAGEAAKRRLMHLMEDAGDDLCCKTHLDRSDKYGRLLVEMFPHSEAPVSLNEILLNEGHAVVYPQSK